MNRVLTLLRSPLGLLPVAAWLAVLVCYGVSHHLFAGAEQIFFPALFLSGARFLLDGRNQSRPVQICALIAVAAAAVFAASLVVVYLPFVGAPLALLCTLAGILAGGGAVFAGLSLRKATAILDR